MAETNMNRLGRRRRTPSAMTTAGVALVMLLASASMDNTNIMVNAFALPKLRSRMQHYQSITTDIRVSKAPQEVEQRSEAEDDDSLDTDTNSNKDRSSVNGERNNGKEILKNGVKSTPPGTPLSMISDETQEDAFEIHLGRALDTLRSDYPKMLTKQPEFFIFDKDLEVIDPSGVKIHGLNNYKRSFQLMQAIVQLFYCKERSGLTCRMCYDKARQNIRVSWNAEVVPKAIFGGVRTTLHVDGISVYEISRKSGMITQHRIESLVINDTPVTPSEGIFAMLRNEHDESVPAFNFRALTKTANSGKPGSAQLEFRKTQQSSLFASRDVTAEKLSSTALRSVSDDSNGPSLDAYPGFDWDALENKNAYRKKFGLQPFSPEEFLETEAKIRKLESQQLQRQRAASASAAAELTEKSKSPSEGFLSKLLGDIVPESCESNYDCEKPEVCCDFGFKQICCSSGNMVGNQAWEPRLVPVPADMYQPGQEPQEPGRF